MEISGEIQGMLVKGTRKFGVEIKHKRRALGEINQNLIGAQIYDRVVNKRAVSETHQNCDIPNPAHQPKSRNLGSENSALEEDVTIADVEEIKDIMEIDVDDILEETVMDIDGCDSDNPLAVVEYADDLYTYYKKVENSSCVSPNYMAQQSDINEKMRAILIDWLIEVHHKFDLRDETLFLTVSLIDRYLAQQVVARNKLQLVGLVALLLACKYEEVSVPIVDDLIYISDKAYTRKEILDTEKLMLNTLQFNMSVPTPYVFMNRYLKAAQADKKLELLSFFLMELCLVEYQMLKYSSSFLAASAIYTAQSTLFGYKQWSKTCERYTSYSEDELLECSKLIVSFHKKAATGRLTGIHRKYNTFKFEYVAKIEPAEFAIDTELRSC